MPHILKLILLFPVRHLNNAWSFLINTLKELSVAVIALAIGYRLALWLHKLDPNIGFPDPSIFVLLIWNVVKFYLAMLFGHAAFRIQSPTAAKFADSGELANTWTKLESATGDVWFDSWAKILFTQGLALVYFLAALTALLLAP